VEFYGYYGVVMCNDCNMSCVDTSGYITAGIYIFLIVVNRLGLSSLDHTHPHIQTHTNTQKRLNYPVAEADNYTKTNKPKRQTSVS